MTSTSSLITPPPEPPTDEEIATAFQKGADQEFHATVKALAKYCDAGVELTDRDVEEVLLELRRPHIAIYKPEPPTELPVLTPGYIDFEHTGQDREILDAFYRACNSEGGTADEIHLRGIRAVLERWGKQ
jgi:hypothetical protein